MKLRTTLLPLFALVYCAAGVPTLHGADDVYLTRVKPVLKARCFACHGALKQESGLRLDTAALIAKGGEGGAVIRPGSPNESELIARVTSSDESVRMPPEGHALTREEIAAMTEWIRDGARQPENEQPEEDPRDHWAFRSPRRGEFPGLPGQHPIDAFLDAARAEHGLRPIGPVEKSLLLRRAYLDLIGLPPTREQLARFLRDDNPTEWDRVVSELLDSPHYGERWGRHWMDVWRYTDWFGLGKQLRNSQKHIWHWRDWIVESLNEDKGYDRMIVEMLAGDEIAPTDADTLRATGFLARNYFLFNRTTWLDETIEHSSKAFLGLTMNCCKCHDHKYDPLSQVDYYRLRAFFEPHQVRLDSVPGQLDLDMDGLPRVFDAHPDAPTYLHIRGNAKEPDKSRVIEPGVPALLAFNELAIEEVSLPIGAHRPALRRFVLDDKLAEAAERLKTFQGQVEMYTKQLAGAETDVPQKKPNQAESKGEVFVSDSFDAARPDVWETGLGEWKYEGGHLVQTQTGATRKSMRIKRPHPQDFEAVLRFRVTGGDKWKSVGLTFDSTDGREKMVYMSAVSGGSKVQVSWKNAGGQQYPTDGKQDRPVNVDQWYALRIAARGPLLNVSIDDKLALAYRLPVKRESGSMELIAFDAAVEFDSLEVRTLPADAPMIEAGKPAQPSLTPEQIKAQLAFARGSVEAQKLAPEMYRTAFAADVARYASPPAENVDALIAAAAKARRAWELAGARNGVASVELSIAMKDGKDLPKKLAEAKKKLAAAEEAVKSPGTEYTFVRASLKALEGPAESSTSRNAPYPNVSTGRRTALARWIADRRNPLTARVAVNHIWMRHFGQPLVDPVSDFGRRTKAPPLQGLLDWLAVEFMDSDWSMKHLHRLIVTSHAYRLSTSSLGANEVTQRNDPENNFYWRRRPVRMESQIVRDSVLHLAGRLDLKLGGPTIAPNNGDANRRSMYFTHSRDDQNAFLKMFDDADILRCYRRQESIVPQQALTLANSRLSLEAARALAGKMDAGLDDHAFLTMAFETVLCRPPDDDELAECSRSLSELRKALQGRNDVATRARAAVIHALLNHNDFVTIR